MCTPGTRQEAVYVVRVVKDIDTSEEMVIYKDASFSKKGNEDYYTISKASFCVPVEVDGVLQVNRGVIDRRQAALGVNLSTIQGIV